MSFKKIHCNSDIHGTVKHFRSLQLRLGGARGESFVPEGDLLAVSAEL